VRICECLELPEEETRLEGPEITETTLDVLMKRTTAMDAFIDGFWKELASIEQKLRAWEGP